VKEKEDEDRKIVPPLAYRLGLFFGRPFGLRWVPDNHLGAVYRMEMYHSLRGPGFFRINPLMETVKHVVSLNPDFISTRVSSLQTKDALQLGLRVALAYVFDPRSLPREKALVYVKWPKHIHRAIVTDNTISVLQTIMPQHNAEQVCRGQLFETIAQNLMAELTSRLRPLAMQPILTLVLEVMVPPSLQETFTAVANRAAYTHDLSQYQPFELDQVQRRELNEVLRELPGGIRYLNVSGAEVTPPSRRAGETQPRQIVQGQATVLPPPESDTRPDSGISPKSHLWSATALPPTEGSDTEDDEPS
jgi:hypothetical protein